MNDFKRSKLKLLEMQFKEAGAEKDLYFTLAREYFVSYNLTFKDSDYILYDTYNGLYKDANKRYEAFKNEILEITGVKNNE